MNHNHPQPLNPPFIHDGEVISGEQVGRTLNFPTANLDSVPSEKILNPGVYFGTCHLHTSPQKYHCLTYFGPRLVFGQLQNNFEVFIYDFEQSIYQHRLAVTLTHFIRPPVPFESLEKLVAQMEADKAAGLRLIKFHLSQPA